MKFFLSDTWNKNKDSVPLAVLRLAHDILKAHRDLPTYYSEESKEKEESKDTEESKITQARSEQGDGDGINIDIGTASKLLAGCKDCEQLNAICGPEFKEAYAKWKDSKWFTDCRQHIFKSRIQLSDSLVAPLHSSLKSMFVGTNDAVLDLHMSPKPRCGLQAVAGRFACH